MVARGAEPAFADARAALDARVDGYHRVLPEIPTRQAGYYHDFFCPEHAVQLVFDPRDGHHHACPVDGRVFSGEPFDSAWGWSVNDALSDAALRAAIRYALDGGTGYRAASDLGLVRHVLAGYAERYRTLPPAPIEYPGEYVGVVCWSALDESVWIIRLAWAAALVRSTLSADEIASRWRWDSSSPAAEHLGRVRYRQIQNVASWDNSANLTLALLLGEDGPRRRPAPRRVRGAGPAGPGGRVGRAVVGGLAQLPLLRPGRAVVDDPRASCERARVRGRRRRPVDVPGAAGPGLPRWLTAGHERLLVPHRPDPRGRAWDPGCGRVLRDGVRLVRRPRLRLGGPREPAPPAAVRARGDPGRLAPAAQRDSSARRLAVVLCGGHRRAARRQPWPDACSCRGFRRRPPAGPAASTAGSWGSSRPAPTATPTATPISSACSSSQRVAALRSTRAPRAMASGSTTAGTARPRVTAACSSTAGRSRRRRARSPDLSKLTPGGSPRPKSRGRPKPGSTRSSSAPRPSPGRMCRRRRMRAFGCDAGSSSPATTWWTWPWWTHLRAARSTGSGTSAAFWPTPPGPVAAPGALAGPCGYDVLSDVRGLTPQPGVPLTWTFDDALVDIWLAPIRGEQLFVASAPGNPAADRHDLLVRRVAGQRALFAAVLAPAGARRRIRRVEWRGTGRSFAVTIATGRDTEHWTVDRTGIR